MILTNSLESIPNRLLRRYGLLYLPKRLRSKVLVKSGRIWNKDD